MTDWIFAAREKDYASLPTHMVNLLAELQAPIIEWASDVDLALQSLGQSCDELRARVQGRAPVIVPTPTPLVSRFVDNGDGTISDNKTGLMWAGTVGQMSHADALAHCAGMTLLGHADWRLPTIEELCSIIDYSRNSPACTDVFNMLSSFYWSSSTYVGNPQAAWGVNFTNGYVTADYKSNNYNVRAVRGGKP